MHTINQSKNKRSDSSSPLERRLGGEAALTAIFDVGKTNKKLFLFDEQYNILHEESSKFEEIKDEDGFECEDVHALTEWIKNSFDKVCSNPSFNVKAVNFSAYGASFVHVDENGNPATPLYNYLKPYPEKLKQQFYNTYGGESLIARQTASPVLGSLNSGMQLYRLKCEQPDVFKRIQYSMHLPQYLSYILSSKPTCDITSIGCHTQLWHFQKNNYHNWVQAEEIDKKFPAIFNSNAVINIANHKNNIAVGIGLHDSSAALIPYLKLFKEPFVLISTGTWCISLNPFNTTVLSDYELHNDCLCYLSYEGKPVKASRLFAGYEHEQQVKKLAAHFNTGEDYYKTIVFNHSLLKQSDRQHVIKNISSQSAMVQQSAFANRPLQNFKTYEEAYHQFMSDIIAQQVFSTKLVLANAPVKQIFVDGGFGKNDVYMNLLAAAFPGIEVFAASIPQASALGAALALHNHVQGSASAIPNLINLKYYPCKTMLSL
ncbi:FGGY-family carbohydrate kinase [Parafilimonas sp.]|uniref:FGGY-family carbohydrate kinase n=1 Tax=Parafilimonas sp. TaxID=1969739 RepID=UPI0039E362BD